jgi:hypothetical protein
MSNASTTVADTPIPQTFPVSCHCGQIKLSVTVTFSSQRITRCNCSICAKRAYTFIHGAPATFILPSETPLADFKNPQAPIKFYSFNQHEIGHYFCSNCGAAPFTASLEENGDLDISVNLNCVDFGTPEAGVDFRKMLTEKGRVEYWGTKNIIHGWDELKKEPWDDGAW